MRRVLLLALGLVLCGAVSSPLAPGLAAQTKPAANAATHEGHDMEKMLVAFADAWNRHDVDALMSFMTPDGVFEASGGNTVNGERYEGAQAVRAAYAAVFTTYADARWNNARHFVAGDRGCSEWLLTGTSVDGARIEVRGCDLFAFRGGLIVRKDSYWKIVEP